MTAPWVGVVAYHLPAGRIGKWLIGGYAVPENYIDAIRRAGGHPVLIPPGGDDSANELLDGFDALVLVGGGDMSRGGTQARTTPRCTASNPTGTSSRSSSCGPRPLPAPRRSRSAEGCRP